MTVANDLPYVSVRFDRDKVPKQLQFPVSEPVRFQFEDVGIGAELAGLMRQTDALSQRFSTIYTSTSVEDAGLVVSALSQTVESLLAFKASVENQQPTVAIADACRIAAVLHCICPMGGYYPDSSLVVSSLVQKLKASLSMLLEANAVTNALMLWLFYVGAVSALGVPERRWFVQYLVVMLEELQLIDWNQTRSTLEHVMSRAVFCESSFQDVWVDIVKAREAVK